MTRVKATRCLGSGEPPWSMENVCYKMQTVRKMFYKQNIMIHTKYASKLHGVPSTSSTNTARQMYPNVYALKKKLSKFWLNSSSKLLQQTVKEKLLLLHRIVFYRMLSLKWHHFKWCCFYSCSTVLFYQQVISCYGHSLVRLLQYHV